MNWQYSTYSKINPEILNHFPFENPRKSQLETVSEILYAIDKGYKYIVLEAGTGTGKSAIAATLASIYDSSYILTVTKQLQDQYLRDFSHFCLVKGRSNFQCLNSDNDCSFGKCITRGYDCEYSLKHLPPQCPYFYQKYRALNAKTVISNYHYMFLELNYVEDFQKRDLMICDEAHNLESMLMNQLKLEFSKKDLKRYLKYDLTEDIINQLDESTYTVWIRFIENIKNEFIKKLEKTTNTEMITYLKKEISDCNRFIVNIAQDPEMWIFDWDDDNKIAQFKPVKVNNYGEMLFRHAETCIFMSATILDYKLFAEWLGISLDDIYAIRKKSPFNPKNNSIITYGNHNLSKNYIKNNASKSLKSIAEILEKHKNEKGIIHTVSGRCSDYILDNLDSDRLISHGSDDKSNMIDEFIKSDRPLVLVSPSLDEGVDLSDDLCRFQIIYKIPYPDLASRQIKTRMKLDSQWYDYKTALRLIQTHGRGMRNESDYCRTYVTDSRFKNYVISNPFIPDTFKNAIISQNHDELVKKGDNLLENGDIETAIVFFTKLINTNAFVNDAYPYLKLSIIYRKLELYEQEVNVIVRFMKSGVLCTKNDYNYFKDRLDNLEVNGYFDSSLLRL